MKHKILVFSLILLSLFSCNNDLEITDETKSINSENSTLTMRNGIIEADKPDIHSKIVLGDHLINPYSVTNMQNAFNYYNQNVPKSPFKRRVVNATHYYIKIMPLTEAHLEALDKLDNSDAENTPILHDFPLDYEVITQGDYYVDPKSETDLYHPAYTVIPVGYQLPDNLPFQVLEDLYYPKEDEEFDVETVSLFFANWEDDLRADDIILTEEALPQYLINSLNEDSSRRRRKFRPEGTVLIENTDSGIYDPLMQAKISIGRSFWWKYTYTDDSGHFVSPKRYRGRVNIRAKWRGYTATIRKAWNEVLGLWVSDHLMSLKRNHNNKTRHIGYIEPSTNISGIDLVGGHLWIKGTTHNGLRKYIDYCNANGIDQTISYANVWAWSRGGASATPMLHKYQQLPLLAQLAAVPVTGFWHHLVQSSAGTGIALVPHWLRPDQIYQGLAGKQVFGSTQSNTVRVHQLVFHESGHYSHARKAGTWFWAQLFSSELNNSIAHGDSYVNGVSPTLQHGNRIALAEGWATFTEFKMTNFHYGKSYIKSINGVNTDNTNFYNATAVGNANSIERFMENFNVYDRPMTANKWDDNHWFMHGIMWDLIDDRDEIHIGSFTFSQRRDGIGAPQNNILDEVNISGVNEFDLSPVFNNLDGSINTPQDLRDRMYNLYLEQLVPLRNLFFSYGY